MFQVFVCSGFNKEPISMWLKPWTWCFYWVTFLAQSTGWNSNPRSTVIDSPDKVWSQQHVQAAVTSQLALPMSSHALGNSLLLFWITMTWPVTSLWLPHSWETPGNFKVKVISFVDIWWVKTFWFILDFEEKTVAALILQCLLIYKKHGHIMTLYSIDC